MSSIITTIGPASLNDATLQYFAEHNVKIARLNFSHNTSEWHTNAGLTCRKFGFDIMFDTAGPKVLLGTIAETTLPTGGEIAFEYQDASKTYPYSGVVDDAKITVIPCQFKIYEFAIVGNKVLIDDGKVSLIVRKIVGDHVICETEFGGLIKSNKGVNLPGTPLHIDFLVDRDLNLIGDCLPAVKPEYIAPSFVKNVQDLTILKGFINELIVNNNLGDYYPKICTKIEMAEAVSDENLEELIKASDMIMIARGDLALEAHPINICVPFYQEKIKRLCRKHNTPFVVATQILESMMSAPVPTRAEVSDLYRAVVLDQADYVMLSGESAAGAFPTKCVELMDNMIVNHEALSKSILGE